MKNKTTFADVEKVFSEWDLGENSGSMFSKPPTWEIFEKKFGLTPEQAKSVVKYIYATIGKKEAGFEVLNPNNDVDEESKAAQYRIAPPLFGLSLFDRCKSIERKVTSSEIEINTRIASLEKRLALAETQLAPRETRFRKFVAGVRKWFSKRYSSFKNLFKKSPPAP